MPLQVASSSLLQSVQTWIRDAHQRLAETLGAAQRARQPSIEATHDDRRPVPVSSNGHAGPAGEPGGKLDVSG